MKTLKNEHFIFNYEEGLENFVKDANKIAENKIKYLNQLFNCTSKEIGQLKISVFTTRTEFVNYIKSVSNGHTPPEWATGCFYNNEIQMLVDAKDENDLDFHKFTPFHESVHLYIKKLIYEKYNISRITWFDECFATYLDGEKERNSVEVLKRIVPKLKKISKNFDVNKLNDSNLIVKYNGYDMFYIIGKYIFENKLENEYLHLLIQSQTEMQKIGKTILNKAVNYFENYLNNLASTSNLVTD